jgi:Flp pilus assembly protein CpaB
MRWSSVRRRLPLSSKVYLGFAAACAVAAFGVARGEASRSSGPRSDGPTVPVVVAAHDLPGGLTLGEDDLRVQRMPATWAPVGALASPDLVAGSVLTARIAAGEAVTASRVARSILAGSVAEGRVAVTAVFASVPAGLTVADRVDAFATFGGARPFTTIAGEDLRVLRIDPAVAGLGGRDGIRVTLDVDPSTARQLMEAAATGTLALAVRGMVSVTASPSPPTVAAVAPG